MQADGLHQLAEEEVLKESGGMSGGRLIMGDLEFQIGDGPGGIRGKNALPKGTKRE